MGSLPCLVSPALAGKHTEGPCDPEAVFDVRLQVQSHGPKRHTDMNGEGRLVVIFLFRHAGIAVAGCAAPGWISLNSFFPGKALVGSPQKGEHWGIHLAVHILELCRAPVQHGTSHRKV